MAPPLNPLPSFNQLPLREGDPPNSAWGLWGDGLDSALGSLNYLTNDLVLRAIQEEIKTGERVGLKYVSIKIKPRCQIELNTDIVYSLPLDLFNPPLLGRVGFEQKVIDKSPLIVNDDVVSRNPSLDCNE